MLIVNGNCVQEDKTKMEILSSSLVHNRFWNFWQPPPVASFKTNLDWALFEDRLSEFRGRHKKREGYGYSVNVQESCSPTLVAEVETMATMRALVFAMEIGIILVIL